MSRKELLNRMRLACSTYISGRASQDALPSLSLAKWRFESTLSPHRQSPTTAKWRSESSLISRHPTIATWRSESLGTLIREYSRPRQTEVGIFIRGTKPLRVKPRPLPAKMRSDSHLMVRSPTWRNQHISNWNSSSEKRTKAYNINPRIVAEWNFYIDKFSVWIKGLTELLGYGNCRSKLTIWKKLEFTNKIVTIYNNGFKSLEISYRDMCA